MTTVSDLFDLTYGHSLELNRLTTSNDANAINFVSRTARHNGVSARVTPLPEVEPSPAGTITVALNGQGGAGTAFLQPAPYYTGFHVMVLTPKAEMSDLEKLWWVSCITANRFRFGFGRQANKSLPALVMPNKSKTPKWVTTTELDPFKGASDALSDNALSPLKPANWKAIRYDELFEIKKGQRLTKANMNIGDTPFIGAIDKNNGLRQFVSATPNHEGNTITVNYNGSVGEAFYQPSPFWASDDVNVLYPKFALNQHRALFLCALIRREQFRYNYARKWHLERMNETLIKLPTSEGLPDWDWMEDYIKSLPYSKSV